MLRWGGGGASGCDGGHYLGDGREGDSKLGGGR